jgi:hypothetical protein
VFVAAVPDAAEAQWRRYRVGIGVGRYWGPGPYGPYRYGAVPLTATVRLQATPRDARVYVDGYEAGDVDDFDGIFQRLRVLPGGHEITLYREGYLTERRTVYLSPGAHQAIQLALQPLGAGQQSEPPPPPSPPAQDPRGLPPRERGMPPADPTAPPRPERFGTIALTVQPADAEVHVDGEKWAAPDGQSRLAIRLPEGRHRIEIRKEGFATFAENVLISRDRTMTLNVSLVRDVP